MLLRTRAQVWWRLKLFLRSLHKSRDDNCIIYVYIGGTRFVITFLPGPASRENIARLLQPGRVMRTLCNLFVLFNRWRRRRRRRLLTLPVQPPEACYSSVVIKLVCDVHSGSTVQYKRTCLCYASAATPPRSHPSSGLDASRRTHIRA